MIVKISIWILQSYDFTILPAQNNPDLSRIFAIVQNWQDRTIMMISNKLDFLQSSLTWQKTQLDPNEKQNLNKPSFSTLM